MAKRNLKSTRNKNKIDKSQVAQKLEQATKKVLSKNLFLQRKKQDYTI